MAEVILDSKHKVVPVTAEEDERQRRLMKGHQNGTIRLQPGGWYYTTFFTKFANSLYNFKYKSSDVIIMTVPRSGTTWTQEIVWTMQNNPNLDNPKALSTISSRFPQVDFDYVIEAEQHKILARILAKQDNIPESAIETGISLYKAENHPDPRTIKTHLPLSLMPPNLLSTCKVIYVARNPKAACISYYYLCRLCNVHGFNGTFEQYFNLYLNNEIVCSPFMPHVLEAWNQRNHKNLLFLFYEDMKADPLKEYRRIDEFLGTNLTQMQLKNIVAYTDFLQMKTRCSIFPENEGADDPFVNKDVLKTDGGFFRNGESNTWKSKLTKEQNDRMDKWIAKYTEGTDLRFK